MSTDRITDKHLKSLCDYLNKITNSPLESWTRNEEGKLQANIGHFYIDGAYGGVMLARICTDGGGITCPLSDGHDTKRTLYYQLRAYIRGIEEGKHPS